MSDPVSTTKPSAKRRLFPRAVTKAIFAFGVFLLLYGILFPAMPGGIEKSPESSAMQQARSVNLIMFSYSNDHEGQYPEGKSSTEVFQKLLDGGYATDPAVFYLPLPGKIKPVTGEKLKPENVAFDVTAGVDSNSPDQLPVVFMTGYRVTYAPGGSAVFISKPYSSFIRSWEQWWNNVRCLQPQEGIAVGYKSNSARYWKAEVLPDGGIFIPNFISPDFKPDGKTYRQQTPDGFLP